MEGDHAQASEVGKVKGKYAACRARKDCTSGRARGVYEKVPGSNQWWIRYADATGRIRREKAGRKGAAIDLYRKRKTETLEGKKLPEKFRRGKVSFAEVARDTLEYSRATKVPDAYRIDRWHMETIPRARSGGS